MLKKDKNKMKIVYNKKHISKCAIMQVVNLILKHVLKSAKNSDRLCNDNEK